MSGRAKMVSKLKTERVSRAAYMKGKLSVLIPAQIRALRLKSETPRQEDLAREAEMKQSRISTMENPGAVNFNLETLIRLASALKVGLVVKFVSFSDMLRWENECSQDAFNVVTIDDDFAFQEAAREGVNIAVSKAPGIFRATQAQGRFIVGIPASFPRPVEDRLSAPAVQAADLAQKSSTQYLRISSWTNLEA